MKYVQTMTFIIVAVALTACGGGGSGGGSSTSDPVEDVVPLNEGGSPSEPASMDFNALNEIKADTFYNHFKFAANAGDVIVIKTTLEKPITDRESVRCSASTSWYTGIYMGETIRSCDNHFLYKVKETREYVVKFGYLNENNGFFQAALIPSEGVSETLADAGVGGLPDFPGQILFSGKNEISSNSFFNYYAYYAKAGETIYLQSYVDPKEGDLTTSRCSPNGSHSSRFSFGWKATNADYTLIAGENYGPRYSCDHYAEFTFEEDGLYVLNFRSFLGGTGYFRATTSPSPL